MEDFSSILGMPLHLSEVDIDNSRFAEMASEAVRTSGLATRAYVKMNEQDVMKILELCK